MVGRQNTDRQAKVKAVARCSYAGLVGRQVSHPLDGRPLPIIADDLLVKMEFGTGAVKITPAHDPNDFAAGARAGRVDFLQRSKELLWV